MCHWPAHQLTHAPVFVVETPASQGSRGRGPPLSRRLPSLGTTSAKAPKSGWSAGGQACGQESGALGRLNRRQHEGASTGPGTSNYAGSALPWPHISACKLLADTASCQYCPCLYCPLASNYSTNPLPMLRCNAAYRPSTRMLQARPLGHHRRNAGMRMSIVLWLADPAPRLLFIFSVFLPGAVCWCRWQCAQVAVRSAHAQGIAL